jgi:hypothetical protein
MFVRVIELVRGEGDAHKGAVIVRELIRGKTYHSLER